MDRQNTIALFLQGPDAWNLWASPRMPVSKDELEEPVRSSGRDNPEWYEVDFQGYTFEKHIDFSKYLFPGKVKFVGATFKQGATFSGNSFCDKVDFSRATFEGDLHFSHAICWGPVSFDYCVIHGDAYLTETWFNKGIGGYRLETRRSLLLDKSVFCGGLNLPEAKLGQALSLNTATLRCHVELRFAKSKFGIMAAGLSLAGSNFQGAEFNNSNFQGCILTDADFSAAQFEHTDFTGCRFNTGTDFSRSALLGSKFDKFGLYSMNNNGGSNSGISQGMLMDMEITDDVSVLRQAYGGVNFLLHLIFLGAFIFPYAWFAFQRYGEARFVDGSTECYITLLEAMARYVFNGGLNWQQGYAFHWTFCTFIVALIYNILRWLMLRKTVQLELSEKARGLPARFSLSDEIRIFGLGTKIKWHLLNNVSKFLFWIQLGVLGLSSYHFLSMRIPIVQ